MSVDLKRCDEKAFISVGFPQTHDPDKIPAFLTTVMGNRICEKLSRPRGTKEREQLSVTWCPGWDSATEKGHQIKTSETRIMGGIHLIIRYHGE